MIEIDRFIEQLCSPKAELRLKYMGMNILQQKYKITVLKISKTYRRTKEHL